MQKFCPKCGKETNALVNSLCKDCFLEKFKPVELPAVIEFEQCRNCGKLKLRGKMLESSPESLAGLVLQALRNKMFGEFPKVKIEFFEKPNAWNASVKVDGKAQGVKISQTLETVLKPKVFLCDACMKMQSSYYEATIQLRFSKKVSQELLNARLADAEKFLAELRKKDSLAGIVKAKALKNGLDLMIGGRNSAKKLARHFAKESTQKIIVSSTLAGVDKKGHDWSRFTYCIRL